MINAAIYARFSSDNQRDESIDAQIRAIKEFANKEGYRIIKTYTDEAKSAKTDNRPAFLQMLSDSSSHQFQAVICHKLDRFARNRYDSAFYKRKLRDEGIDLVSVLEKFDDSPESIILESVLEGMNEYYSANLSREVVKGLKENAYKCQHTGGKPPFGFDVIDKKYVINESEAEAVRTIFTMIAAGQSYSDVREWLKDNNYRSKYGTEFKNRSINELLKNEKYIGTYIYNKNKRTKVKGKLKDIPHSETDIIRIENGIPSIIDKESFNQVQEILQLRKKAPGACSAREIYLLTGKIKCGKCGSVMNGHRYWGGRDRSHLYITYQCSAKKKLKTCDFKDVNRDELEKIIINELDLNYSS